MVTWRLPVVDLEFTIHELLVSCSSAGQFMSRLIDAHEQRNPAGDWAAFRQIDYGREIPRLRLVWFPSLLCDAPPANVPIAGLWFGLNLPIRDSGEGRATVADFYVWGTSEFKLDGLGGDWASVPAYAPDDPYSHSNVLENIYRIASAAERVKH